MARNAVRQAGAVRYLNIESGPRVHFEDHRSLVVIDDHIHAKIAQPRHFVAAG